MPNKYSHALVLSHYEARGLVDFQSYPKRPSPANSPTVVDRVHPQRPQNPTPVIRSTPPPPPSTSNPLPIPTSSRQSSIVSKPTPPITATPRAVFDDSPPSTPDPPRFSMSNRYVPSASRRSRRSSLDQGPARPTRTAAPTTSRGYKHIETDTLAPNRPSLGHNYGPPSTMIPPRPSALKEIPRNTTTSSYVSQGPVSAGPITTPAPRTSLNHNVNSPSTICQPCTLGLKEIPRNTITPPHESLGPADTGPTTAAAPRSLGLKELPRNTHSSRPVVLDSNHARPTSFNSSTPRPQTAGATSASEPPTPSHLHTLTAAPSFQSSRSSHCTTDSIVTQVYAPDPMSPPPTPPRSSASFETAIFAPPISSPKISLRHEPPSIPPRSSSIPRPSSSSVHHPDFDAFSSTNSPTLSSPNSTFTSASSFHPTPRTSYSRTTAPSLPSKSPDRELEFNPDQVPAPNPEVVPFSQEPGEPWGALDELPAIFRVSMDSEHYTLDAPSTRNSSFDEAAPPPITRTPRTQGLNPTTTKKTRRVSLTLFRPDYEAIPYNLTTPGPAPIPVATAKDAKIQERSSAVIEKEYAKRTGKWTTWSLMSRVSAARDPFEDKRRGRGFSRAVGTGVM